MQEFQACVTLSGTRVHLYDMTLFNHTQAKSGEAHALPQHGARSVHRPAVADETLRDVYTTAHGPDRPTDGV